MINATVRLLCDGDGTGPCPLASAFPWDSHRENAVAEARQRAFDRNWGRRIVRRAEIGRKLAKPETADMCPTCTAQHRGRLGQFVPKEFEW